MEEEGSVGTNLLVYDAQRKGKIFKGCIFNGRIFNDLSCIHKLLNERHEKNLVEVEPLQRPGVLVKVRRIVVVTVGIQISMFSSIRIDEIDPVLVIVVGTHVFTGFSQHLSEQMVSAWASRGLSLGNLRPRDQGEDTTGR